MIIIQFISILYDLIHLFTKAQFLTGIVHYNISRCDKLEKEKMYGTKQICKSNIKDFYIILKVRNRVMRGSK
jgi:hypothetical protein